MFSTGTARSFLLIIFVIIITIDVGDVTDASSYNSDDHKTTPEPRNCFMKPEPGPCDAQILRYYYDEKAQRCSPFFYGGCKGNGNNYQTYEHCNENCKTTSSNDDHDDVKNNCDKPPQYGPCSGIFVRFYFNQETRTCKAFFYGGCKSNGNNYETIEQCRQTCLNNNNDKVNKNRCQLQPIAGPCNSSEKRYFYSNRLKKCVAFIYGGCLGNENNFLTRQECKNFCEINKQHETTTITTTTTEEPSTITLSPCEILPRKGSCSSRFLRWYFDRKTKTCRKFIYSGCGGNSNNFRAKHRCEMTCLPDDNGDEKTTTTTTTTTEPNTEESSPSTLSVCDTPPRKGPCRARLIRWYFDTKSKSCRKFYYGGCKGNANNFRSLELCKKTCSPDHDDDKSSNEDNITTTTPEPESRCEIPPKKGVCKARLIRWYFDTKSKKCRKFYYGGCGGNANNFKSLRLCKKACSSDDDHDKSSSEEDRTATTTTPDPGSRCEIPPRKGHCKARLIRWYFDTKSKKCRKFYYGGCGGNSNNFKTKQDCKKVCSPIDESSSEEKTTTTTTTPEPTTPEAEITSTLSRCEIPPRKGVCKARLVRWYFDTKSKKCRKFYYGGCGGNANNFKSLKLCKKACSSDDDDDDDKSSSEETTTTTTTSCPSHTDHNKFCHQLPCRGPCHGQFRRFYYDAKTGKCQKFTYGGCGGNANNFPTLKHCETFCPGHSSEDHHHHKPNCQSTEEDKSDDESNHDSSNNNNNEKSSSSSRSEDDVGDICQLKPVRGKCAFYLLRYYYDAKTKRCRSFIYSGCDGNQNRFVTKQKCYKTCRNNIGAAQPEKL